MFAQDCGFGRICIQPLVVWLGTSWPGVGMINDKERIAQKFLIERLGVEVGNICSTLDQLRDHVYMNGDIRTKVTVDVVVRRLRDIHDDARAATGRLLLNSEEMRLSSQEEPQRNIEDSTWNVGIDGPKRL